MPANDEGLPGAGSLRRSEDFQKRWRDRRAVWAAHVERDRGAVVFIGDAIDDQWATRIGADWRVKVAVRSIDGDTTRGVLVRLSEDVISLKPAAVVLQIGTNDVEHGVPPETSAGNLKLILAELERYSPDLPIVLCQVFPSMPDLKRPASAIKALNAQYLDVVMNRKNITYLETWVMLAGPDGNARAAEFADGLRLNQAGYAEWAAALRPVFATLGLLHEPADQFTPETGFVSLFNGVDLTGWGYRPVPQSDIDASRRRDALSSRPPVRVFPPEPILFTGVSATPEGRYVVIGGNLVVTTPPEYRKVQQLWTAHDFPNDFVLKLEFRATPNADSGVYLRGPQLQVRDYSVAGPYEKLKLYHPQDWNELVVTVRGEVAECTCNGEVIESAFKVPRSGAIGLEGDRGQMEFRRIRVKAAP